MSPHPTIEHADFGNSSNRIAVAAQSLDTWCKRRQHELAERDCSLRLAIAREADAGKRAALAKELQQTERELQDFSEGVKNSSLRRAVGGGREFVSGPGPLAEQRFMPVSSPAPSDIALDTQPPGTRAKLSGVAAVYDTPTDIGNFFREVIRRGAFAEVIKTCDCRTLFNHDSNHIFGRTTSGTLRLYDATPGLVYWCDLLTNDPPTEALVKRIQRRDLTGCSFSFIVQEDRWELAKKPGELPLRIIEKIGQLYDVGPVTFPSYPTTVVEVIYERSGEEKAADDAARYAREMEEQEWEEFDRTYMDRRKIVERKYRLAGRIINRCRQKLQA